jgi:flagellar basal-body rod protein FlgB
MNVNGIFGLEAKALQLFSKRADILANNLANVSTPHFKARDIDFRATLQNSQSNPAIPMPVTIEQGHIPISTTDNSAQLLYRNPMQPSMDDNTVDADMERVQFVENAMKYQVSLNFVNNSANKLIKAFRGE